MSTAFDPSKSVDMHSFEQASGLVIGRLLGKGGMGEVFEGLDLKKKRKVAIKRILPELVAGESLARFEREGRVMKGISPHPNIVQLYDFGVFENGAQKVPYMAVELVEGGTLEAFAKQLPLPREERLSKIMLQVLNGLSHVHQHGVVHRDMKLENILVTADGVLKIADFGLGRDLSGDVSLTKSGDVMGTPMYMAPEQAMGEKPSPKWDVWSAGVMLFQLLYYDNIKKLHPMTVFPYLESNAILAANALLIRMVQNKGRVPLQLRSGVKNAELLEQAVLRMTAHNPHERYSCASDAASALNRWLRSTVRERSVPRYASKKSSAPYVIAGACGLSLLAGMAGMYALTRQDSDRQYSESRESVLRQDVPSRTASRQETPHGSPVPPAQQHPDFSSMARDLSMKGAWTSADYESLDAACEADIKSRLGDGVLAQTHDLPTVAFVPRMLARWSGDASIAPAFREYVTGALDAVRSQRHDNWNSGYAMFLLWEMMDKDERIRPVLESSVREMTSRRYQRVELPGAVFNFMTEQDVPQSLRGSCELEHALAGHVRYKLLGDDRQPFRDTLLRGMGSSREGGLMHERPDGVLVSDVFGIDASQPARLRAFASGVDDRSCNTASLLSAWYGTLECLRQDVGYAFEPQEREFILGRARAMGMTFVRSHPNVITARTELSGRNGETEMPELYAKAALACHYASQLLSDANLARQRDVYVRKALENGVFASPEATFFVARLLDASR